MPAPGAPVQTATGTRTANSVHTIGFASGVAANACVVALVERNPSGPAVTAVFGYGASWIRAAGDNQQFDIWVGMNAAAGTGSVQVNYASATGVESSVIIAEFANVIGWEAPGQKGGTTSTATAGPISPTYPNITMVIGARLQQAPSGGPTGSFTALSAGTNVGAGWVRGGYRSVNASSGTYSPTWTGVGTLGWNTAWLALKGAGSGTVNLNARAAVTSAASFQLTASNVPLPGNVLAVWACDAAGVRKAWLDAAVEAKFTDTFNAAGSASCKLPFRDPKAAYVFPGMLLAFDLNGIEQFRIVVDKPVLTVNPISPADAMWTLAGDGLEALAARTRLYPQDWQGETLSTDQLTGLQYRYSPIVAAPYSTTTAAAYSPPSTSLVVASVTNAVVGMSITVAGSSANVQITAINTGTNTLTLSGSLGAAIPSGAAVAQSAVPLANYFDWVLTLSIGGWLKRTIDHCLARGALPGFTYDFTEKRDSDGISWGETFQETINVGVTMAEVFNRMRSHGAVITVDKNRVVHAWASKGQHLESAVVLVAGTHIRDQVDISYDQTVVETRTLARELVGNGDAFFLETADSSYEGSSGLRVEGYKGDYSNTTYIGTMHDDAATTHQQTEGFAQSFVLPVSHGGARQGQFEPYVDYGNGDWVAVHIPGVLTKASSRVMAITIGQLKGVGYSVELDMNAVVVDPIKQLLSAR